MTLDFKPDGAHEDLMSGAVAMATTTSTSSCPGMGIGTTLCELANGSADAFVARTPILPHEVAPGGRVVGLTVAKGAGSSITLNWFPSCSGADTSYRAYEGAIGAWYSHKALDCNDAGADLKEQVTPAAGSSYYLVVPMNYKGEGSYGKRSSGLERPVGTVVCKTPQLISSCP